MSLSNAADWNSSFVVTFEFSFSSHILSRNSFSKVLKNVPCAGPNHSQNPRSNWVYEKTNNHNQSSLSTFPFPTLNKQEINCVTLLCSICGSDDLGSHHSKKSTELPSSGRNGTQLLAGMQRGCHGTGWAVPSCCILRRWKTVSFSPCRSRMLQTTTMSWSQIPPSSTLCTILNTLRIEVARVFVRAISFSPTGHEKPFPSRLYGGWLSALVHSIMRLRRVILAICADIEEYTCTTMNTNTQNNLTRLTFG